MSERLAIRRPGGQVRRPGGPSCPFSTKGAPGQQLWVGMNRTNDRNTHVPWLIARRHAPSPTALLSCLTIPHRLLNAFASSRSTMHAAGSRIVGTAARCPMAPTSGRRSRPTSPASAASVPRISSTRAPTTSVASSCSSRTWATCIVTAWCRCSPLDLLWSQRGAAGEARGAAVRWPGAANRRQVARDAPFGAQHARHV